MTVYIRVTLKCYCETCTKVKRISMYVGHVLLIYYALFTEIKHYRLVSARVIFCDPTQRLQKFGLFSATICR